ncbi:MAG TPA: CDP-alcohol phosphatidyltransferase [Clostridiaceae bacterium]|nr:CDP-alcohol phosphatidyltransferase [Clostridiaceae bacterium]
MTKYFPVLKYVNIPTIITSLSICAGVVSFILFTHGIYNFGILAYGFALFFDGIDGKIARKLKKETDFGAECDSLSDAINFTVIPALIAYFTGFKGPIAVCVLLIYVISGIWRLANFNISGLIQVEGKSYFTGICTTQAGALFLIAITACLAFFKDALIYFMYPFFLALAILMNLSFKCNKNGLFTKALYVLVPVSVFVSFIKVG